MASGSCDHQVAQFVPFADRAVTAKLCDERNALAVQIFEGGFRLGAIAQRYVRRPGV